jgi:hypothetical protein
MRVNNPERAMKLVAAEARGCTRCPLYKNGSTCFGVQRRIVLSL